MIDWSCWVGWFYLLAFVVNRFVVCLALWLICFCVCCKIGFVDISIWVVLLCCFALVLSGFVVCLALFCGCCMRITCLAGLLCLYSSCVAFLHGGFGFTFLCEFVGFN